MAVKATARATFYKREKGSYTFLRYSNDGGQTFTAASQAAIDAARGSLPLEGRNILDMNTLRNGEGLGAFTSVNKTTNIFSSVVTLVNGHFGIVVPPLPIFPRYDTYTLSGYLRSTVAVTLGVDINGTAAGDNSIVLAANTNTYFSVTFTGVVLGVEDLMSFYFTPQGGEDGFTVTFDKLKLEVGEVATAFSATNIVNIENAEKNSWAGRNIFSKKNFQTITVAKFNNYLFYATDANPFAGIQFNTDLFPIGKQSVISCDFTPKSNNITQIGGHSYCYKINQCYIDGKMLTVGTWSGGVSYPFVVNTTYHIALPLTRVDNVGNSNAYIQPNRGVADTILSSWEITNVKLEYGDTSTPWTPAPEDCTFGTTEGEYMGTLVWDKPYPSNNPADYTWGKVKGETGKGISSVTNYYLATTAGSGVTTSTGGWTTSVQAVTATNRYLWNYEVISYTDGTSTTVAPHIIGVWGDTGPQGPKGDQGIQGQTGAAGKDAVTVRLVPDKVVVDTDTGGHVTAAQLANAVTTVEAYKGGAACAFTIGTPSASSGIGYTKTTTQVTVASIADDTTTGYAYGSGFIDIPVTVDGVVYKVRLTVETNIHKVVATLKQTATEITASVSTLTQTVDSNKTTTDARIAVAEGKINTNVTEVSGLKTRMTSVEQTASGLTSTVAKINNYGVNVLYGVGNGNGWLNYTSYNSDNYGFAFGVDQPLVSPPISDIYGQYTLSFERWLGDNVAGGDIIVNVYQYEIPYDDADYTKYPLTDTYKVASLAVSSMDFDDSLNRYYMVIDETSWSIKTMRFAFQTTKADSRLLMIQVEPFDKPTQFNMGMAINQSQIKQTATQIEMKVKDCGIDIDERTINLKAENCNFIGADGLPYIKVKKDDKGMPHFIFLGTDGVTEMYDLGYTGLKSLITKAHDGIFNNQVPLFSIDNVLNNPNTDKFVEDASYVMSVPVSNIIAAYKYSASYSNQFGTTIFGDDGIYDSVYYKSNSSANAENLLWLSDTSNIIPDGWYAKWETTYRRVKKDQYYTDINIISCYQISNGRIEVYGNMYVKSSNGLHYFTDENGNRLRPTNYTYIKDYIIMNAALPIYP